MIAGLRRRARVVVLLLAATTFAAPAPAAESGDAAFNDLAVRWYDGVFRAEPVFATEAGVHTFDTALPDRRPRAYAQRLERDRRFLGELAGLSSRPMSARTAMDAQVLANAIQDDLLRNGTMQDWRKRADDYVSDASSSVFDLGARRFAPASVRLRDVVARENAFPAFFATARANLTNVDRASAEVAFDDASGMVSFLEKDLPSAFARTGDAALRTAFRASTKRAAAAARAFARWLQTGPVAHPHGTYAIGAENFAARLRYEEGVELPVDEYARAGDAAFAQTHAQIMVVAHQIDPQASVAAVIERVARAHPTAAGLLPAARRDLSRLRSFEVAHQLVRFPPGAHIDVIETPQFERATTVASMDVPGPLERVLLPSRYDVTPVDPHDPPKVQEAYLETFNDFERPIVSAHEVYPGHFYAYFLRRHEALSLTEKLAGSASFSEGWAHYCEQMIVDAGWGNGDPRVRLMQLREAILRNARWVVGVRMHTGGMSVSQAEAFFAQQAFFDKTTARIEARRGTQDPTYGYYTLGKLEILKLRSDYQRKLGASFRLADFHERLLSYGDVPIPYIRRLMLGSDDDGEIL